MEIHFFVGNDNGNSEHDILIDGKLIQQPNVNLEVSKLPFSEDVSPESLIPNLLKQLVVTIDSPSVKPGMYQVGEFALASGEIVENMQVGIDKKAEVDLPIVNTLANIAGYGVQKAFTEKKEVPESLSITVDMATALPIKQYTGESATLFEKRFMEGPHSITVHIGKKRVKVEINFDFVKTIPEGAGVTFALQYDNEGEWRKGDIFKDFIKEYNLGDSFSGQYFKDKRNLHTDIGDGTTEYPITTGNTFERQFVHGSNHGAGHAIETALDDFNDAINLMDSPRQFFSKVAKDTNHKYYSKALKVLKEPLIAQAKQILSNIRKQLTKARNEVDIITVYGGGSILMKDYLYPLVKELADDREIKLLYIPKQYAVKLNAEGLYYFVNSPIFEALKQKAKQTI